MHFFFPSQQVQAGKKTHQPVKMISVKMADKYAFYPLKMNPEAAKLELGPLSAIDQVQALICVKQMSAWVSI